MTRDEFADIHAVVKTASDRTRSALYIFMVVNFAIFITLYGANLLPRTQERLEDLLAAALCVNDFPPPPQKTSPPHDDFDIPDGESAPAKLKMHHPVKSRPNLDCLTALDWAKDAGYNFYEIGYVLSKSVIQKRLESLVSDEVSAKRVNIPLISFSFDIDYLWLLTSFFGPLGMMIILSCLKKEVEASVLALETIDRSENEDAPGECSSNYVAKILMSTQVLLGLGDGFVTFRNCFLTSIFILPIITQLIGLYYDFSLYDILADGPHAFLADSRITFAEHPIVFVIQILGESLALAVMMPLVVQFIKTTGELHEQYSRLNEIAFTN